MSTNKPYSEETVTQVLEYLNTHSYSETAKHFKICKATVGRWVQIHRKSFIGRKLDSSLRPKINKIFEIAIDDLKKVISGSTSYSNLLVRLGLDPRQHYLTHLKNRIGELQLDVSCFEENTKKRYIAEGRPSISDRLCINSNLDRSSLRIHLIRTKKYECEVCGNDGVFLGKPLTLQVDHINGINNDNRIENLRFLCPNCHSQQPTSFGKNKSTKKAIKVKTINNCLECGTIITNKAIRCMKCDSNRGRTKKFEITKEELTELVNRLSFTKIGNLFGVSDNAVRKRCNKLGIDVKQSKFAHK